MCEQRCFLWLMACLGICFVPVVMVGTLQAQEGGANPTPLVITLTPTEPDLPTAVASPTDDPSFPVDAFEPNNEAQHATPIGIGVIDGLTLLDNDLDYFTGYLKGGQMVHVQTAVYESLDTRIKLFWAEQLMVENDDRSPADVASSLFFTAPADGWYLLLVEKATVYNGRYDLSVALVEPTLAPTSLPTFTPTPTTTPLPSATPLVQPDLAEPNNTADAAYPITPGQQAVYTIQAGDVDYYTFLAKAGNQYACETLTDQVDTLITVLQNATVVGSNDDRSVGRVDSYLTWQAEQEHSVVIKVEGRGGSFGQYGLVCQQMRPVTYPVVAAPTVATSVAVPITTSKQLPLAVQYIGKVPLPATSVDTRIRLLVYYDANNDRQPGLGEGIANVSVVAVDAQGQRIARVFTNSQGEAVFHLTSETVARVMVPFVPGWSARVRVGEMDNEIVLGLPAVRLPIFLPVQSRVNSEE